MADVLVTRPEAEAKALADRLRALGHTPVIEPLLDIRFPPPVPLDLTGAQGLVLTSANGVQAAAMRTPVRALPVFTVGAKTAASARAAGFTDVTAAEGNGRALADLLTRTIDPTRGRLVHVGGAALAVDIAALLRPHGLHVDRVVGYEAVAAEALSPETLKALDRGALSHALFFSPRTARTFVSLIERHGRTPVCAGITALCLSPAVAEAAAPLPWREVKVAGRMAADDVVELLD